MPVAPTGRRGRSDLLGHSRLDREVRDLMRPGVISLPGGASLRQVQRTLASHEVHAVLIADNHTGKPLGWVTARGLLDHASRDLDLVTAASVVSEPAVTISPSASVRTALDALLSSDGSRLLVCQAGCDAPEGVVTDLDLVKLLGSRSS
jgi:CBS domain-containing protein